MVDFQERDTTRGLDSSDDESASGESDEHEAADVDHDHHQHDADEVGVAVLTVSSSRTVEEDESGDAICAAVEDAGNHVVTRELVGDDHDAIQRAADTLTKRDDVDLLISTGGTGVTPDDVTIEAVGPLFDKRLPGFGEVFRRRSEEQIGTRVIATRAAAGIAEGVPVFCLPGSEEAVRLGTSDVILPEAGHLVGLAARDEGNGADEHTRE